MRQSFSNDIPAIRDRILEAALPAVVFDGWGWQTIERAARDAGYETDIARAVFPGRMMDVMKAFSGLADRKMIESLAGLDPSQMRVRDRVRCALVARFEYLNSCPDAACGAMAWLALPTRKPAALKMVWRTADCIWDWAGDTATDYNRYTKRGLLSGIIMSASLVWLNDDTPDMEETKGFIDRRIENVMQFGKLMGRVSRKAAGHA